jgi:hypothetical protein
MVFPVVFSPPRRLGLILNLTAAVLLTVATGTSLTIAFTLPIGRTFFLLFLLGIVLLLPLGGVLYRIYALLVASYTVDRDGLRLRWGLRAEDIPIPDVQWVRPASDLVLPLRMPLLSWPGAMIGVVHVPDIGPVEFLASERSHLLLIATPRKVYAISPADMSGFSKAFRRTTELGSLAPLPSFSARPAAYITHVWSDKAARIFFLAGLGLTLMMFAVVSLGLKVGANGLGLNIGGVVQPDAAPAVQKLLLPFLGTTSFAFDALLGLTFYRRGQYRGLAYLLWASGAVVPLIFIVGIFFTP